ncbi:MAG: trigger factor [Alphaproteobacteria bacterium]|nr:trigger factor [Alphaproteobacteria bacterium]
MQVTETKNEGLSREFSITVPAEELERRVEARLGEVGQQVNLPGFRPGKAPMKILKQRFGDNVLGEVLEQTVNESTQSVMSERDLKPAMQPKIEITSFEKGADLVYTVGVELMPEIEPVDFSTLSVVKLTPKISDQEVEQALEGVANDYRSAEPIEEDRPTQTGDVAVIDFVGKVDGEPFEGGAAEDFRLELGSGRFIPGFEDQLVGAKKGDAVEVKVTFPEDYGQESLAGKDAVFDVTVKGIEAFKDTAIDDEFAKNLGMESLEQLRGMIRERLGADYGQVARARMKRGLLDQLYAAHDFPVPDGMIEQEFEQIWTQFEQARAQGQIDDEDKDKDDEALKAEYRDIAHRRVQLGLLLSHVGERANIEVSQDELNRAVVREAQRYPGQEREVFEAYSKNPELMAQLRAPIFEDKTIDYIVEQAQVEEKEIPVEELLAEESDDEGAAGAKKSAKKASKKAAAKKAAAKKGAGKKAAAKQADAKAADTE